MNKRIHWNYCRRVGNSGAAASPKSLPQPHEDSQNLHSFLKFLGKAACWKSPYFNNGFGVYNFEDGFSKDFNN